MLFGCLVVLRSSAKLAEGDRPWRQTSEARIWMQCEAYSYRFSVAKIVKLSETAKCFLGKNETRA